MEAEKREKLFKAAFGELVLVKAVEMTELVNEGYPYFGAELPHAVAHFEKRLPEDGDRVGNRLFQPVARLRQRIWFSFHPWAVIAIGAGHQAGESEADRSCLRR